METIVPDIDTTTTPAVTYYYGKCQNPGKSHTGHEVVPYPRDDSMFVVKTHCGNYIFQWDEGERPPEFETDDLCMTCNRSWAWGEMQKALAHRRQVEDELAGRLDELAARVEANDLNDIGVVRALHGMAEELRRVVQPVPNGESKGNNLRLLGQATA